MTLSARDLEIRRPCPTRLDPRRAEGGVKSWYCEHCDKAVHVLSNMTRSEASAFLEARAGEDICVTYAVRRDGSVRFAPEPTPARDRSVVPVSALVRRPSALAAAGLGLALAACAPHDAPHLRPDVRVADAPVHAPAIGPTIPDAPRASVPAAPEPEEILVDGDLEPVRAAPEEILVDGGITAAEPKDEPCDPPRPARPQLRRGMMRARG